VLLGQLLNRAVAFELDGGAGAVDGAVGFPVSSLEGGAVHLFYFSIKFNGNI
jgi:hypothetical protein